MTEPPKGMKLQYRGKDIDELSVDELKQALYWAMNRLEEEKKFHQLDLDMQKAFDDTRRMVLG